MKGGGARLPQPLRLDSQRFRLLSIVVGCFVICLVFLLSSRPDATAFDTMSPRASLVAARRPAAVKTLRTSSSSAAGGAFGGDFHVDILPQQQRHQEQSRGQLRRSAEQAGDKTATESVRDTVIVEETSEAEPEEDAEPGRDANGATAAASSSDDRQPGAAGADEKAVHEDDDDNAAAVGTGQPAADTTSTAPDRPDETEKKTGAAAAGGQSKVQQDRQRQEERHDEPAQSGGDHRPLCDFSDFRSDICDLAGDVRLDANASGFVVVGGGGQAHQAPEEHRVRPYPRKGDETCMRRITEITVRRSATAAGAPRCTRTHASPAVVFSIGGYTGNIFHDFSDVLVPLYNTARRYGGGVQLVLADSAPWWLVKYDRLLRALSRHAPLDLAGAGAAGEVHCFARATVSLRAHKELIIERERSADGLATPDFTRFLRRALALPRDAAARLGGGGDGKPKPRLLIISRRRTRLLLNLAAVVRAAEEVGFEAVVNESDVANDIAQVGALINSCDAMVGVHGAGLTNMVFLPPGAALVQIVPWGGLQWMARADYGDPAEAMGLRYVQYEVAVGESTLKDKFPEGHEIFTNPTALHKKGFMFIRQTLMDGQDITVDVARFREVLLQVLNNLAQ